MARFGRTLALAGAMALAMVVQASADEPKFQIDTSWPKPMPNNWILGQIGGIFVDKDDNVWITQRPRTVNKRDRRAQDGEKSKCCFTAPSVIEFNQAGDVVKSWGGPETAKGFRWPQNESGTFHGHKGNLWVGGNGENRGMVVKFRPHGKFPVMTGEADKRTNSLPQNAVR